TSLIIEGSNLLPTLFDLETIDLFLVLYTDSEKLHRNNFFFGDTHARRQVNESDFLATRELQEFILRDAKSLNDERVLIVQTDALDLAERLIGKRVSPLTKSGG